MTALSRRERFEDLLPDFFRRFSQPSLFDEGRPSDIKIDVTENDKDYLVRADLPGVKKEDISVSVDGNFVSISTEVKRESETKSDGGRVLVKETYAGSASRGFTLAHEIDEKGVSAKLEDGVLKLTLPKRDNGSTHRIAVQ